jgi:hypothetical protein
MKIFIAYHTCVVFLLSELEYGSKNMTSTSILHLEFHISSVYFHCGCDNGSLNTFLIGIFVTYITFIRFLSYSITMFFSDTFAHIHLPQTVMESEKKQKNKLCDFSPQANHTNRATAACRRSLVPRPLISGF